ncbi:MAG: hypothetical protein Q8S19_03180, partial [Bacillota bacterium]|nr:hypothetical protein [Bacillota bacterium]
IPYLVANPLEIVYIDQPNSQDRILFINGLADKQVEDKINERLKSLYIDIKQRELPSYRGIKSKIPANSKPLSNDLHVSVPYNYNNVMSIILNNSRDYQTQYVNIVETLNFDLNTGEEITLKDVFTDDVDHVSLLSDHVSRLIQKSTATEEIWSTFGGSYMGGHNIKLVSPFKGILPDQKFNLFQGGLSLVFDYRNLEFDTMFMTDSLQIYFCDTGNNIAVTQRFYAKDSNIYTSKAPQGKEFVQTTYPSAQQIVVRRQEVSARYVSMSYSYPEGLPGHMVKFIRELSQTADKLLDQPDIWELHHSVSAGRVGSYVNVYASLNMYAKDRGDQLTQYYCFDSDYKQLSLSKLFVHGYDYRTVIMEKL